MSVLTGIVLIGIIVFMLHKCGIDQIACCFIYIDLGVMVLIISDVILHQRYVSPVVDEWPYPEYPGYESFHILFGK